MNRAIVSIVQLLALAAIATAAPTRQTREERVKCYLFSISTVKFVKLSSDGKVTADGQKDDSALYVENVPGTKHITIESAKSTRGNPLYLTFEDDTFKSGSPLNGNEVFERVPVDSAPGYYALSVVNPIQVRSGSGSGETEDAEADVNVNYLGFARKTGEAGLYTSIKAETMFLFLSNHE